MIAANDLRIGNYFMIGGKVIKADIKDIAKCKRSPALRTPIPLTEEILMKAGFEKEKSNDIFERTIYSIQVANGTSLYFDAHKDWMRCDKDIEWYLSHEWNNNHFKNDFWNTPKHLHQLQNLYHALTGHELEITL